MIRSNFGMKLSANEETRSFQEANLLPYYTHQLKFTLDRDNIVCIMCYS